MKLIAPTCAVAAVVAIAGAMLAVVVASFRTP